MNGADDPDRTGDRPLTKRRLYLLSYVGDKVAESAWIEQGARRRARVATEQGVQVPISLS